MTEYFQIELSQGKVARVSPEDWDAMTAIKWYSQRTPSTGSHYAGTTIRNSNGRPTTLQMHRLLMGSPKGFVVDHRNGDTLDNRRENLRLASVRQNCQNTKKPAHNTSGFKGVWWSVQKKRWRAQIRVDGKLVHLGAHASPEQAHESYCRAAAKYFGEFARTA